MKNNDPIETQGYFWLPNSPNEKLPGTLFISKFGEVSVDLLGIPGDYVTEINKIMNGEHEQIDRICGIVRKGGYVTLTNCRYHSVNTQMGGGVDEILINAETAFIGGAFGEQELTFTEYDFWLEGLSEWLNMSGIDTNFDLSTKSGTIEYHLPEPIAHVLSDGTTLSFEFAGTGPPLLPAFPPTDVRITQTPYISLKSSVPQHIEYFNSKAITLSRFFSLAVDEEVQIQSVKIITTARLSNDQTVGTYPIRVYCNFPAAIDKNADIKPHRILFRYADVSNLDEMINSWLSNYKTDTFANALDSFFLSRSNSPMSLQSRFLNLCQSVEVIHRRMFPGERIIPKQKFRHLKDPLLDFLPDDCPDFLRNKINSANQLSLRDRVERMMTQFENWFEDGETSKEFAKRVSDTRNVLTHLHGRTDEQASTAQELGNLYNKLETLATLYVLKLLGLTKSDIASIIQDSSSRLGQELRVTQ